MPSRKTRKKPARKTRSLWAVLSAALIASLTAAGGLNIYARRRLAPLLDRDWRNSYTSRIYSSPHRLRTGDRATAPELRSRLKRLGYRKTEEPPAQGGQYRETGSGFDIYLRRFSHPFVAATPIRVIVELKNGQVGSLRLASTNAPLLEVVLDPVLLYELSGPKHVRREPLAPKDIPQAMLNALVAIEDRRFYEHPGIDARAILRAAWSNLRQRRYAQGGSTLTQQLARNLFLTRRKTFSRKIREALLSLYLETRFSKNEILALYLSNVYFGQKGASAIIGLRAAARHFHDKPPARLTIAECAMLAGLLRAPNSYTPFLYPEAARARRDTVLRAMRREGYLSRAQAERAQRQPLTVTRAGQRPAGAAGYFLSRILRALENRYGRDALVTQGLIVHTTLDPWLQQAAVDAVRSARHQAALVALNPRTGAIRAFVGGKDFRLSPYDRAASARRQPGSAFKPFVYGAALRPQPASGRSWTPSSLLSDTTRSFRIENGSWTPRNYKRTYRGPVRLATALALSLNAATVNLAAELGPKAVIRYARNLGIHSPLRPELGLALGVFEVSLLELTGAYCAFANGGYRVEPYAIELAIDAEKNVLEYHSPAPEPVISPGEAYLMTSLLREAVTAGTGRSLSRWGLDDVAAGKTGTTDKGKDAWFIGYTPRIAAGVWSGSDTPAPLGLTGAGAALPIWARFIRKADPPIKLSSSRPLWPRPEDVFIAEIDPASGKLARAGCLKKRKELFLAGTVPAEYCPLHAGGLGDWLKRLFRRRKQRPSY